MSAMDEYEEVRAIVRGKEYWAVGRSEVADAADAAIAELEQKNSDLLGREIILHAIINGLKAELAEGEKA